jgi:hypothetical protein
MLWMLISGATFFAVIVAATLMAICRKDLPAAPLAQPACDQPAARSIKPEAAPVAATQPSEETFLAAAEPVTRKFLEARRIEDMLPLVRNPGVAEARMRRHYPDGKIDAPGMTEFDTEGSISRHGTISSLKIQTCDYQEKSISYVETPQGVKIDWEGWVGWSEMPWQEFLASKPTTGKVFRVTLRAVDYYNFNFADDKKWQAYRLESPDRAHALYGYAEQGSVIQTKLRPPPDSKPMPFMLALKFPANAASGNQVLIEQCLADGWVLETEPSP